MTTILVVDDSVIDREIAGRFVEDAGYTAAYAADGPSALALVERDAPDMVLTDMRMPDMDGLELVKEMRTHHRSVPVVLMTGYGSEEIAVAALRAGAAHYVPKSNLQRDLKPVIGVVLDAVHAARQREQVRDFLRTQESYFVLGYEPGAARALVSHLQDALVQMQLCEEDDLIRVGTALTEALSNALHHGNLELDSALRDESHAAYWDEGKRREALAPYRDRRVHVTARFTTEKATFVVRDEGPGYDVASLPDPTDPENLTRPSGRGVMLIRMFMDEVRFNESGNEITMVMKPGTAVF